LDYLVKEGKIRYIGTSNFDSWVVYKILSYTQKHNLAPVSVMQEIFNLVDFDVSREKFSLAQKEKIPIMVYSPLAGGFFTGKYRQGEKPPEGSRGSSIMDWEKKRWEFRFSEIGFKMLNLLSQIAKKYDATISQVAISYLLSYPEFASIIIGSRNISQLKENIKSIELHLEEEDINIIKEKNWFF
jgi:aryl-alcohol dehydrogenase-like predicted oxidoreductase